MHREDHRRDDPVLPHGHHQGVHHQPLPGCAHLQAQEHQQAGADPSQPAAFVQVSSTVGGRGSGVAGDGQAPASHRDETTRAPSLGQLEEIQLAESSLNARLSLSCRGGWGRKIFQRPFSSSSSRLLRDPSHSGLPRQTDRVVRFVTAHLFSPCQMYETRRRCELLLKNHLQPSLLSAGPDGEGEREG